VFEVDHPATQAWKRERLDAAGIRMPANLRMVPVDFERDALGQQLEAAGLDARLPVVTAWLGVVPYLTLEAFRATLRFLGSLAPASRLVFDYSLPREALSPVEKLMLDSMAQRVRQAGEPFQLFFTPEEIRGELCSAGITVHEDLDAAAINAKHFAQRNDGLQLLGSAGRVCLAVNSLQE
jgi:methyltransferase (TIGR00027 family)